MNKNKILFKDGLVVQYIDLSHLFSFAIMEILKGISFCLNIVKFEKFALDLCRSIS